MGQHKWTGKTYSGLIDSANLIICDIICDIIWLGKNFFYVRNKFEYYSDQSAPYSMFAVEWLK